MIEMKTLARGALFKYEGSIKEGIKIEFGRSGYSKEIPKEVLGSLLKNFSNMTVPIEATRTVADLHKGSLGHWLNRHVSGPVITSYIASVLVHEGYAEHFDNKLTFKSINELGWLPTIG